MFRSLVLAATLLLAACMAKPAPPPSGPPSLYLVFFPRESVAIGPLGEAVVQRAIADARAMKPRLVTVNGYADRLGAAEHNKELSEQRAAAVANALVAGGVDRATIRMVGLGEDPLPDAATDGRRVEIKLLNP